MATLLGYKVFGGSQEPHNREYYCRLKDSAWEKYDKHRDYSGAIACFYEIYKWSRAMTNEVLRYKSSGGIAYLFTEQIENQDAATKEQRESLLRRCNAALRWIEIVEQIDGVDAATNGLMLDDKEGMIRQAAECRRRINDVKSKFADEAVVTVRSLLDGEEMQTTSTSATHNPYEMAVPLGALRGLATAVMSPCDIVMAWPFAFENGDFMVFGIVPTFGFVVSAGYMLWDVGFGVVDFCSLGYAGNKWYDEETSPWWWQRFSGKQKAAVFR